MRERLFTPRLHFVNYAELNAWLEARCLAQARENAHPEQRDKHRRRPRHCAALKILS